MNKTLEKLIHFSENDVVPILHSFAVSNINEINLMDSYTLYKEASSYAENIDLTFNTNYKQWVKNAWDDLNFAYKEMWYTYDEMVDKIIDEN